MPNPILVLSGPIGAGKTTVGRELGRLLPAPLVYIEGDTFWSFLAKGGGRGPTPESFLVVMASMTAAAVPFAMADSQVILDFSIPPWFLKTARAIAGVRQVALDYVVLRPPQQICAARAAARPEGKIPDCTPYRELYQAFDEAQAHILSDEVSADEMARRILKGVKEGRFRLA